MRKWFVNDALWSIQGSPFIAQGASVPPYGWSDRVYAWAHDLSKTFALTWRQPQTITHT
jgi:hypothetical protein